MDPTPKARKIGGLRRVAANRYTNGRDKTPYDPTHFRFLK
jgi:hypothetical protein